MRTRRLFLRPAFPEDRLEGLRTIGSQHLADLTGLTTLFEGSQEVQKDGERNRATRKTSFVVTLPGAHGAPVIGVAGFLQGADGAAIAQCCIAPAYQGNGYAGEAQTSLLPIANMLGYQRMVSRDRTATPVT